MCSPAMSYSACSRSSGMLSSRSTATSHAPSARKSRSSVLGPPQVMASVQHIKRTGMPCRHWSSRGTTSEVESLLLHDDAIGIEEDEFQPTFVLLENEHWWIPTQALGEPRMNCALLLEDRVAHQTVVKDDLDAISSRSEIDEVVSRGPRDEGMGSAVHQGGLEIVVAAIEDSADTFSHNDDVPLSHSVLGPRHRWKAPVGAVDRGEMLASAHRCLPPGKAQLRCGTTRWKWRAHKTNEEPLRTTTDAG